MTTKKVALGKPRKLLIFIVLVLTIVGLITYYHSSILISLGGFLITEHPLEKADAVVVLAGSVPDRILEAIDIYQQGYAPLIILTKEEKPDGYDKLVKSGMDIPERHDLNRMIAIKLGVPAASIIVIDKRAYSTQSEMQVLSDFLGRKNFKSVIIVTSKSHTARATKLFNLVTNGKKIKVLTRPSKYDTFDPTKWWLAREGFREVLFEYQKLAHYYLLTLTDVTIWERK